jgi:DNA-nicking Smr family endonuclease
VLESFFTESTETVSAEQTIHFAKSGLQNKTLRKLRQGQLTPQATLDLHGLTSLQAQQVLLEFIAYCKQRDFRCVRIIHGKGRVDTPTLKNKVNQWLRQLPAVLAFHSAPRNDGGTGALYVLLRNQRKERDN